MGGFADEIWDCVCVCVCIEGDWGNRDSKSAGREIGRAHV